MAGQAERLASETIWSNQAVIIPMCDVQHIEKIQPREAYQTISDGVIPARPFGVNVVMKSTRWNFESMCWDNAIYLHGEEARRFIADYCYFRSELDPVSHGPQED